MQRCSRLEVEPQLRQQSRRRFGQRAPIDEARASRWRLAKKDVLGYRQLWNQVELLIDHPDAERQRIARALDIHSVAVDSNLAAVFAVRTAEDLHQRRFAGSVLAEQHVHFAGVQRQVDAVERDDAGKCLADPGHLEHWSRAHRTGISSGGPPGVSDAAPSHCRTDGPGTKRSSREKTRLSRVMRDRPAARSFRGCAWKRTAETS